MTPQELLDMQTEDLGGLGCCDCCHRWRALVRARGNVRARALQMVGRVARDTGVLLGSQGSQLGRDDVE